MLIALGDDDTFQIISRTERLSHYPNSRNNIDKPESTKVGPLIPSTGASEIESAGRTARLNHVSLTRIFRLDDQLSIGPIGVCDQSFRKQWCAGRRRCQLGFVPQGVTLGHRTDAARTIIIQPTFCDILLRA